jgi:hypothetical protein
MTAQRPTPAQLRKVSRAAARSSLPERRTCHLPSIAWADEHRQQSTNGVVLHVSGSRKCTEWRLQLPSVVF